MKLQLPARIAVATDLIRKRDLGGAMDIIRAALGYEDANAWHASDGGALTKAVDLPQPRVDAMAVADSSTLRALSPGLDKVAARSLSGHRLRPLSDVLASLKTPPVTSTSASNRSLRRDARLATEPLPRGATFAMHSFATGSGQRNYKIYVPRPSRGGQRPLVMMLHGCTQDADDFAIGTRMNRLADELDVLVAYPEQSTAANKLKCWSWFNLKDQKRDTGEPAIIAGITRSIVAKHDIDPRRIYVAGLSAGGAMAAVMAMTYPDIFSAVGVHSGLPFGAASDIPSAFAAMRNGQSAAVFVNSHSESFKLPEGRPRCIIFHGEADMTVHPANGDRLFAEACRRQDIAIEEDGDPDARDRPFTRRIARTQDGRIIAEHWTIPDGGHAWSGGDPRGSYASEHGPEASREMMRFFLGESVLRR